MTPKQAAPNSLTIPFEKFWAWLQAHANCILRAGTPDTLLFDHDDYHWHLGAEDEVTLIVQLVRGKDLVGELLMAAAEIAYVHLEATATEEYIFECVVENATGHEIAYHFVMAHDFEEIEPPMNRRWTH